MRRVGFSVCAVGVCALTACLSSTPATDDGGSSSEGGSPGTTSSSGGSGSSSGGQASSSSGTTPTGDDGGSPSSQIEAAAGTMFVPIVPDANGYIGASTNSLGIQGAWYAYGDDWGTNGAPPGNCETMGMHATTACSSITSPLPAMMADGGYTSSFPQMTPGTMCLSGTAAKVVGGDYSNMFGIGIGLDFNNQGGVKMPYNATANNIIGFTFQISGIPTGASVRVELPIPATAASGDAWSIKALVDKPYTMDLTTMTSDPNALTASFTATGTQPPFDATMIQSIQFHIPTNVTVAVTIPMLCVSNLQAIVKLP